MSHTQTLQGTGGQMKATKEPKKPNKEAKAQMESGAQAPPQKCAALLCTALKEAGPVIGGFNARDR